MEIKIENGDVLYLFGPDKEQYDLYYDEEKKQMVLNKKGDEE